MMPNGYTISAYLIRMENSKNSSSEETGSVSQILQYIDNWDSGGWFKKQQLLLCFQMMKVIHVYYLKFRKHK